MITLSSCLQRLHQVQYVLLAYLPLNCNVLMHIMYLLEYYILRTYVHSISMNICMYIRIYISTYLTIVEIVRELGEYAACLFIAYFLCVFNVLYMYVGDVTYL